MDCNCFSGAQKTWFLLARIKYLRPSLGTHLRFCLSLFGEPGSGQSPWRCFLDPIRVFNLGTPEAPVFHGNGWLPANLTKETLVLTPVLSASPHKGKWGLRKLKFTEVLLCLDVLEGVIWLYPVSLCIGRPQPHSFWENV